jgi:hypothetical protein
MQEEPYKGKESWLGLFKTEFLVNSTAQQLSSLIHEVEIAFPHAGLNEIKIVKILR